MTDKLHPSHKTRGSDASRFDEICTVCGATDRVTGGWGALALPCPGDGSTDANPKESPILSEQTEKEALIDKYALATKRNANTLAGMPITIIQQHFREFADELAALSAAAGVKPRVKPLEWDANMASSPVGTYRYGRVGGEWTLFLKERQIKADIQPDFQKAESAARSAAQADYEARILSALTTEGE